jgi:hypothetical protein
VFILTLISRKGVFFLRSESQNEKTERSEEKLVSNMQYAIPSCLFSDSIDFFQVMN